MQLFSIYIVLLVIFLIVSISIGSEFFYFHLHLKKSNTGGNTETVIYQTCKWKVLKKLILKSAHITFLMT